MQEKQNKKIELSKESFESLTQELEDLQTNQLPAVIERIVKAREQGDLAENSEYKDAKDQQELVEVRIEEIQEILAQATIIKEKAGGSSVGVGSKVTLQNEEGKKVTYEIVGEFDKAAENMDTISAVSPMGKVLMGKKSGDQIAVTVPMGEKTFKIAAVK